MLNDLIEKRSFEPVDAGGAAEARAQRPPNIGILVIVSLQAVLLVALICVAFILGGKMDAATRAATAAKDAAELAQASATSSAAHVRYVSCEVQRTRPRAPSNFFEAPFACDPPPREAQTNAASSAQSARPPSSPNVQAPPRSQPAAPQIAPATGKGN